MKITRSQLRKIIREQIKGVSRLADLRDSTTEYYTDGSGERRMVPGVTARDKAKRDKEIARHVAEYEMYNYGVSKEDAINWVSREEGVGRHFVEQAVDAFYDLAYQELEKEAHEEW
jgi:hypothetical protein